MPELPEVETVVRTLRTEIVGQTIRDVWSSGIPLRLGRRPDPARLRRDAVGARIRAVRRRGKYILMDLTSEAGILVHLGMTGRLRVQSAAEPRVKHTHLVWTLGAGRELRFIDPRRFGWAETAKHVDRIDAVASLGADPLSELDRDLLATLLSSSSAPIKSFLLDQRRIAGLGNIYVCEALFRAGIHPRTPAKRAVRKAGLLLDSIRETLTIAIANCGTTFRDFVDSSGKPGNNVSALQVYGREGQGCTSCRAPLRRLTDGGRSTFYCARCQAR